MSDKTGIEWTDSTWNPVTGCTEVSPGCDHCYAKTFAERWRDTPGHYFENGFDVQLRPDKLELPLRWKKPRRIFVNSMSDLFHDEVPDDYIARVFAIMALAHQHTFQVLTKRHGRMRSLLTNADWREDVQNHIAWYENPAELSLMTWVRWPLPNVWLGVSAENQQWADIRIPALLDTPAAIRFISAEPLLGPISVTRWLNGGFGTVAPADIDWVIVGGESGRNARPMHPRWARTLRDECVAADIPFLFKQRGEWTWNEPGRFVQPPKPFTRRVAVMHAAGMTAMTKDNGFNPFERGHPHWGTRIERVGKKAAGRELDGRTWDQYPEAVSA